MEDGEVGEFRAGSVQPGEPDYFSFGNTQASLLAVQRS